MSVKKVSNRRVKSQKPHKASIILITDVDSWKPDELSSHSCYTSFKFEIRCLGACVVGTL